jgi:hypothetical protein
MSTFWGYLSDATLGAANSVRSVLNLPQVKTLDGTLTYKTLDAAHDRAVESIAAAAEVAKEQSIKTAKAVGNGVYAGVTKGVEFTSDLSANIGQHVHNYGHTSTHIQTEILGGRISQLPRLLNDVKTIDVQDVHYTSILQNTVYNVQFDHETGLLEYDPDIEMFKQMGWKVDPVPSQIYPGVVDALVLTDPDNNVIVSFRGSATLHDFLADGTAIMKPVKDAMPGIKADEGIDAHAGVVNGLLWTRVYEGVMSKMPEGAKSVTATGHSYGGGAATLFSYLYKQEPGAAPTELVTYGSLRVFNTKGKIAAEAAVDNNVYRFCLDGDFVSLLGSGSHVGRPILLSTDKAIEVGIHNDHYQPLQILASATDMINRGSADIGHSSATYRQTIALYTNKDLLEMKQKAKAQDLAKVSDIPPGLDAEGKLNYASGAMRTQYRTAIDGGGPPLEKSAQGIETNPKISLDQPVAALPGKPVASGMIP